MSNTPFSPDLIIFDLDGTVLDTVADLSDAVCFALSEHGFPKRSQKEVMSFVGNGVLKLIERALPEGEKTEPNIRAVCDSFNKRYAQHYADKTRPYPGMTGLLKRLKDKGIKLAVLSNKPDEFTKGLIEMFFPGIFDTVLGSSDKTPRKPDPTGELKILKELDVTPDRAIHIGDSDTDIMTAKNAGVKVIACSWGYRSREELLASGTDIIADSVTELADMLCPVADTV